MPLERYNQQFEVGKWTFFYDLDSRGLVTRWFYIEGEMSSGEFRSLRIDGKEFQEFLAHLTGEQFAVLAENTKERLKNDPILPPRID